MNGAMRDGETALAKLMHDFFCADPDEMYYESLARAARHFKKDEEGIRKMLSEIEQIRNEGMETARNEERRRSMAEKLDIAARMLALGKLTVEEAAQVFNLGIDKVRSIAANQAKG